VIQILLLDANQALRAVEQIERSGGVLSYGVAVSISAITMDRLEANAPSPSASAAVRDARANLRPRRIGRIGPRILEGVIEVDEAMAFAQQADALSVRVGRQVGRVLRADRDALIAAAIPALSRELLRLEQAGRARAT
jgi:hypothetical protein